MGIVRGRDQDEKMGRESDSKDRRGPIAKYVIIAVLLAAIAGAGGVMTGNWWAETRGGSEEDRRLDEYLGLGERTGFTGDLQLRVEPVMLTVRPGDPIVVNLILVNEGDRTLVINKWFTPAPAHFDSNQLPFKVKVTSGTESVHYVGNAVLLPPHTKDDFVRLRPGERKEIPTDLSTGPQGGRWELTAPGVYLIEVWYETYLTGRYIGVKAWTGMTNHVVVQVTVTGE